MAKNDSDKTKIAVMAEQMTTIKITVDAINKKLEEKYVTSDQLKLVSLKVEQHDKILIGVITIIVTAFVFALIKLVVLQ
jgi:tetrahydromethanopterin S-methyltransferase subunit G